ncbi:MAG: helix-turn-helix domain-containing protein [Candidatus Taylorbacteria bacterium]|nr:helix-turn-helix domain-containing protein [Candidatus Taylorbacteria bacterium]
MTNKYVLKIKEFRIEKGFSQEQVANVIGVSRPTYTAIEAGKQELSADEIQKLAKFYSISVDDLLSGVTPDIEKYKHMILAYLRMDLSDKDDGRVPKTKLAKLLYLADFAWFYENLKSMSGMQYRKLAYGPVPDMFFRAIDELAESGKICIEAKNDGEKEMFLISESESNKNEKVKTLSSGEMNLMEKIAKKWKNKKTQDIVNFTHNQLPYLLCRTDELIPYELITQEDEGEVY